MPDDQPLVRPTQNTGPRVLICAPDAAERREYRALLETRGFRVYEAPKAPVAVRLLADSGADVVIADHTLPGSEAVALLRTRRGKAPSAPVIVVSSAASIPDCRDCMLLGASDYVPKPVVVKEFMERIWAVFAARTKPPKAPLDLDEDGLREMVEGTTPYRLERVLGSGLMGCVFLARRRNGDGTPYALKIIRTDFLDSKGTTALSRFYQEIHLLSQLIHPNIVRIIEFGQAGADMLPYFVMEYLEGHPLRLYSAGLLVIDRPRRVALLAGIAAALEAVHALAICHRDLKPDNVIVVRQDETLVPKLLDFSAARLPMSKLTRTGQRLGTPYYMAPEAFGRHKLDYRADIFSFGVMAYDLLLNRRPFSGASLPELARAIVETEPPDPQALEPDFPRPLAQVLLHCLAKTPEQRPQSMAEVSAALHEFLGG